MYSGVGGAGVDCLRTSTQQTRCRHTCAIPISQQVVRVVQGQSLEVLKEMWVYAAGADRITQSLFTLLLCRGGLYRRIPQVLIGTY